MINGLNGLNFLFSTNFLSQSILSSQSIFSLEFFLHDDFLHDVHDDFLHDDFCMMTCGSGSGSEGLVVKGSIRLNPNLDYYFKNNLKNKLL